ncbi:MAG: imidazole glycerol phosphate synthase subunit HisH [Actinobacteria bacterium]|nr:imidazole glycerol phosphate synthase subunit HisH [Actinomycetota bacterium]
MEAELPVINRLPRVVVLDYGSGNLRSAQRALQRVGADVEVTADQVQALRADGLVVPGVGAFAACMAGLRAIGGDQVIGKRLASGSPVLGICVGMQVLFEAGDEHGEKTAGVGCWPGIVQKLTAPVLPHMGWNRLAAPAASRLLAGIGADEMFYFVHSYAAMQAPDGSVTGWTRHGEDFVALVEDGPLMATQFHPEKSANAGAALLANWLETLW